MKRICEGFLLMVDDRWMGLGWRSGEDTVRVWVIGFVGLIGCELLIQIRGGIGIVASSKLPPKCGRRGSGRHRRYRGGQWRYCGLELDDGEVAVESCICFLESYRRPSGSAREFGS